jgi:hypothetical protein
MEVFKEHTPEELRKALSLCCNTFSRTRAKECTEELFGEDMLSFACCYLAQLARQNGENYEDYKPDWRGHDSVSRVADGRNDASIRVASELFENEEFLKIAQRELGAAEFEPMCYEYWCGGLMKKGDSYRRKSDMEELVTNICVSMHHTTQQTLAVVCLATLKEHGILPDNVRVELPMR